MGTIITRLDGNLYVDNIINSSSYISAVGYVKSSTGIFTSGVVSSTSNIYCGGNLISNNYLILSSCPNYTTNESAIAGSMSTGMVYQTTGTLKIVY